MEPLPRGEGYGDTLAKSCGEEPQEAPNTLLMKPHRCSVLPAEIKLLCHEAIILSNDYHCISSLKYIACIYFACILYHVLMRELINILIKVSDFIIEHYWPGLFVVSVFIV